MDSDTAQKSMVINTVNDLNKNIFTNLKKTAQLSGISECGVINDEDIAYDRISKKNSKYSIIVFEKICSLASEEMYMDTIKKTLRKAKQFKKLVKDYLGIEDVIKYLDNIKKDGKYVNLDYCNGIEDNFIDIKVIKTNSVDVNGYLNAIIYLSEKLLNHNNSSFDILIYILITLLVLLTMILIFFYIRYIFQTKSNNH